MLVKIHNNFEKITPIHKKDSKNNIKNYRPVASLCSSSKIFERLILNRISKLEALNKITLAGKQQHGFVKGKSTATAGLLIQSLIARALDDNQVVLLASLDLSAAFEIVNVDNILGVIFDSKLQWGDQVALSSTKAIKAINAIRLIKRYSTKILH